MVKKIIVLIGIFILLFGSIGFIIEISSYFSSSDYDIFGMVLSVIFIVAGYLVFKFGKNKDKKIDKEKNDIAKLKNKKKNKFHVKIISILGIIFSITNIVIALLVMFSG
jgi:Na+/melibiose symporter-like transporter